MLTKAREVKDNPQVIFNHLPEATKQVVIFVISKALEICDNYRDCCNYIVKQLDDIFESNWSCIVYAAGSFIVYGMTTLRYHDLDIILKKH